jgi:L-iditol 2-dehydrogenase
VHALVVTQPTTLGLEERSEPAVSDGDVLLAPVAVGLCGTDLEIVDGTIDPAYVRYPLVLGHEWCGRIIGPPGTPDLGRLAVVEGIVPCGHCAACRDGATNVCATYDEFGFTRDGALADQVSAPASLVHALAPAVQVEDAVLTEPAAVVWRALRRANPVPGARVLVVGDGTVGLLTALLVQMWSPSRVDLLGVRPDQKSLAARAGASFITEPERDGDHGTYDLVVEAAGAVEAVATAVGAARRGGQVVLLGLPGHGTTVALVVDDVVNNDVSIVGSFSYTSTAWREVVNLLNAGRFRPGFLVTHRFGLQDWSEALSTLRSARGERGKVVIDVRG